MPNIPRGVRLIVLLLAALPAVGLPGLAQAQSCLWSEDKTPAVPPPSGLWNGLEPAYTSLPLSMNPQVGSRDTTWYNNGDFFPSYISPYWRSVDIETSGTPPNQTPYLFSANPLGFQVWSLDSPESPARLSYKDIRLFAPEIVVVGHDWNVGQDLEVDSTGNLGAYTGFLKVGMLIIDFTQKNNPAPLYQDPGSPSGSGKQSWDVFVDTIAGRAYGFLAGFGGAESRGLWAYDMTRAKELSVPGGCLEYRPVAPNAACSGVYKARITTDRTGHVDGAGNDTVGHFVAISGGHPALAQPWGVEIYNVSNVASGGPFPLVLSGLQGNRIDGIALWQEGSRFLLALANWTQGLGQIYDVTCIKTGNCGSLSSMLIYQFPYVGLNEVGSRVGSVQDSVDASGNHWVYFGRKVSQTSMQGLQAEWLFNVQGIGPGSPPIEITGGNPQSGNQPQPTVVVDGVEVGYWSYYYSCHPPGSNSYSANAGQVFGNRFYRAGESILDVHRLQNVNPTINVTGPATGYVGQTLTFNASALNCTPSPTGWTWSTSGGTIVGASNLSSVQIQWNTTGPKTVSATNAGGCPGATVNGASIDILDPAPVIGGVTASPTNAPVCTPITFEATNVTGQPPLSFNWAIEQGGNPVPGEGGPGNPFVWDTETSSPGSYQGRVTVSGPGGSVDGLSPLVTLTALQALPAPGFPITADPPVFGTVQFHSNVAGATEWRWDFDDGTILQTTDPAQGVNPVHTYTQIGTYDVTLQVRNCVETAFVTSAVLPVTINEISPLEINDFRANCPFGVCSFQVGEQISFIHDVEGDPDSYEYDWTNDGNDPFQAEQVTASPVTTHSYALAGSYRPILCVKRGAETVCFTHVATLQVTTGGPPPPPPPGPSITISGPTTREVDQAGSYSASASNCTPNPNGWFWTTAGGTGSSTTNQITITWGSPGTKVITVSNSGCGGATDSHSVTVTDPGQPNPGGLVADFTWDPESPGAGVEVTFDASSSAGQPTGWAWDFGDGGLGSGEAVTHAFATAGVYPVELTISKVVPGSGCGSFGQEICTDTTTLDVTVGGGGGGDCVPDAGTICLLGGRFKVTARWHNQNNGEQGLAKVYTPFSGNRTGMFWFFRPDNVELITKSLDGTDPEVFPEPAYWFFYGSLSNVEYWITVTDTTTDEEVEYHNEPGVICGFPDTQAFPVTVFEPEPETVRAGGARLGAGDGFEAVSSIGAGASGTCVPSATTLCLHDGRFAIEVDWHDQHNGDDGIGTPIVGTDRTGYFWFFNPDNVELVTKIIDGGEVNGYFWVLWGALSDVEYTIRVTDTTTSEMREYHNDPGSFCGGANTTAFETE